MAGWELRAPPTGFGPGWDRQEPWTLRFIDPAVERAYREATARPAAQRLRVAHVVGMGLWITAAALGPPLLGIPAVPIVAAALINCGWEIVVLVLTRRALKLPQVWILAFASTTLSAMGIVLAFWFGGTFAETGAPAMMLNGVTSIGLVRLAAWLAAALGSSRCCCSPL